VATKIGEVKISNSHKGLRFKIGKADIENGQPNDPCNCAAARALKRTTGAKEVFVFRDVTYIYPKNNEPMRYHTSRALRLETIVFDRNGNFYPGEYDLEPMPIIKLAPKRSNGTKSASGRKTKGRPRYSIPDVRPTASQRLPRV